MTWDKDPDKAFPARHPREPGGLRQDILDEIADHLACAAEREEERQEEENREAVWNRVLDRFGNPDAIARKLWWDQMWETVMREWIQTGVMVVVTIAVLAGLAMMTRLVAGVGTANDAMREAMKQVAASNEALAKAMADQRAGNEAMLAALSGIQGGGGEKPDALELSNIEIVVRRGTPEGPPAPEVKVKFRGAGLKDGALTVDAELDAGGRTAFERLYQGSYTFFFEDTKSGLFSEKTITIFAGKGAGEHIIVAPDVEPRSVHIDWNLPVYARDEEQLIETTVVGRWEYEGTEWRALVGVLSGQSTTHSYSKPVGYANYSHAPSIDASSFDPKSGGDCLLSGDISVVSEVVLARHMDTMGQWLRVKSVGVRERKIPMLQDGRLIYSSTDSSAIAVNLVEARAGHFAAELPKEILEEYGLVARLNRNVERVPSEDHETWREATSAELTDSYLVQMEVLPKVRRGEWRDGAVYAANDKVDPAALPIQHIAALALPDNWRADLENGHQGLLGVRIDASFGSVESDNVLEAFVIRSDWRSQALTYWMPLESNNQGMVLELDASPFWSISGEEIRTRAGSTEDFYVPVPADLGREGNAPMTGILLRWQRPSHGFISWPGKIEEGDKTNHSPRWIVTESIDATGSDKPLADIEDGRFHYDKEEEIAEQLTPQEQNVQPAP